MQDWARHVPAGGAVVAPEGLLPSMTSAPGVVNLWGSRPIGNGAILLFSDDDPIRSIIVVTGPDGPPGDWVCSDMSQTGEL